MKHLKTVKATISELGECESDQNDIKLLGTEALIQSLPARHRDDMVNVRSLSEFFSENDKFYYRVDELKLPNLESCCFEIGLGYIKKVGNDTFLVRDEPQFSQTKDGQQYANEIKLEDIGPCEKDHILVINHLDAIQASQLLIDPSTMVYSNTEGMMSALYVEPNTLVAGTNTGIKSQPAQSLNELDGFSDSVIKSIKQHTKDLILQSKNVSAKSVTFKASAKCDTKKAGTVFFDKESKTLKCYDGTTWRTLSYEDT